jgi:DNA polymerase III subunit delta
MPISLYYGDEDYLLLQAVKRLRANLINPDFGGLGHKVLEKASFSDALEAIGAVCFNLGGQTLIEFWDFPFLAKAASSPADEKALEELMTLLSELDASKHVLFMAEKANKTVKLTKWLLSPKGPPVDTQEYKTLAFWQTDEAVHRVMQESATRGLRIEPAAAMRLVEDQGVQLRGLMNEIEKLSVYAAGRAVTAADVTLLSNHNENTFRMLTDWLHNRNRAAVLYTLDELLLRQHPVQLFALAQSWLGNLFRLRYWRQQGLSEKEMAERTKKHPFKIKKDLEEHGRVPMERLEALRVKLLDMEWKAKTGGLPPRMALEVLLSS